MRVILDANTLFSAARSPGSGNSWGSRATGSAGTPSSSRRRAAILPPMPRSRSRSRIRSLRQGNAFRPSPESRVAVFAFLAGEGSARFGGLPSEGAARSPSRVIAPSSARCSGRSCRASPFWPRRQPQRPCRDPDRGFLPSHGGRGLSAVLAIRQGHSPALPRGCPGRRRRQGTVAWRSPAVRVRSVWAGAQTPVARLPDSAGPFSTALSRSAPRQFEATIFPPLGESFFPVSLSKGVAISTIGQQAPLPSLMVAWRSVGMGFVMDFIGCRFGSSTPAPTSPSHPAIANTSIFLSL